MALIERAFTYPRVRRVLAETLVVHAASRRVMEKAGMHPARFFHANWPVRLPGDELGAVTYAIERPAPQWRMARIGPLPCGICATSSLRRSARPIARDEFVVPGLASVVEADVLCTPPATEDSQVLTSEDLDGAIAAGVAAQGADQTGAFAPSALPR